MEEQVTSEIQPDRPKGRFRFAHIDNAKAALIALAVLGSLLELKLYRSGTGQALYLLIWLLVVPGFAYVAGFVSKPDAYTPAGRRGLARLAVIYLVLQLLYSAVQHLATGHFSWYATAVYPVSVLWWLVTVICWRLLLPLFARAEGRRGALLAIASAVAVSLVAGYVVPDGRWLALMRTLVFLPFFVAGFFSARERWRLPRHRQSLAVAVAALVLGFALLRWGNTFVTMDWVQAATSFRDLGVTWWSAIPGRLALLAVSAVFVAALMRLVPRFRNPLTKLGRSSLSVFAWHGLALKVLAVLGLGWLVGNGFINALGGTVLLLAVLGFGPIAVLTMRQFRGPRQTDTPAEEPQRSTLTEWGPAVAAIVVALILVGKAYLTRSIVLEDADVLGSLALELPVLIGLVALVVALAGPTRRAWVWALVVVDAVLSFSMFATAVYSLYFGQVLTASVFAQAGQAAEVQDSILALLSPLHLLYAADLPFVIAGAIWLTFALGKSPAERSFTADRRIALAAAVALLVASVPLVDLWQLPENVNSSAAAKKLGLLNYQLAGFKALGAEESAEALTAEETRELASSVSGARSRGTTAAAERLVAFKAGEFKGKNLIIVQCEALQNVVIGKKIDGELIAPNLTALTEESYYYPRTYSQISRGNTSDAEWIVNTSQYPPPGQAASTRWGDRESPSLPRLLRDRGYFTMTFHANEARFWNRKNMYAALGFDKYFDRADIGWEPHWKWGSSDEVVFDRVVKELSALDRKKTPFYAQIITLTAHHPFAYPPEELRPWQATGKFKNTEVGDYLSSESYADKAIGEFVDDLKAKGLWNDSIVVFYGDHYGLRKPKGDPALAALEADVYGSRYDNTEYVNIPLIIHVPGQREGKTIDRSVGQIDILPTVADALGIDLKDFTHFGRNAFIASRPLIGERGMVPEGTLINDRILFYPGLGFEDGVALDLHSGEVTKTVAQDKKDFEEVTRLMRLSLEYSDSLPRRKGASEDLGDAIIPNAKGNGEPLPPQNKPASNN